MSHKRYLGLIDLAGIQSFIFRQPDLKTIARSSEYIESLTSPEGILRDTQSDVTCMFAAGGNAAYLAEHPDLLKKAFQRISRNLLIYGQGIEAVAVICPYEAGALGNIYSSAWRDLDRHKLAAPRSTGLIAFPGLARSSKPQEVGKALTMDYGMRHPSQFSHIVCRSEMEDSDLMAVVSVDGLGMGRRLIRWSDRVKDEPDDVFCEMLARWSQNIKDRWKTAWEGSVKRLADEFGPEMRLDHEFHEGRPLYPIRDRDGIPFFPCRRLYQGGDDMSFLCDARLALSITSDLVTRLEHPDESVCPEFRRMTVSVGILFADSHFPIARGLALSNKVRSAAKKRSLEAQSRSGDQEASSALDWWINRQGSLNRQGEADFNSTLRPLIFNGVPSAGERTWRDFDEVILPGLWRLFKSRRNKLKDLMAAAEEDDRGAAVARFLALRPIKMDGRRIERPFGFLDAPFSPETGFSPGRRTPLLDAAELFDLHYPFHISQGTMPSSEEN
ncbi:hypothetical protein CCAX7_35730 [Capsulimonas corticalis]|uniref:Cas10/Cmr2 second palm domain-containing protein n=1 Tax=Capsulimonas corticalis TaxID=2219043 RepID=A0A402D697_9BACT|nr:hypothetical protein [Capsulimonas corticalis]BDI31522.1 hypothetical protein CCAX7_35730 [Capsulimonas corticalis]